MFTIKNDVSEVGPPNHFKNALSSRISSGGECRVDPGSRPERGWEPRHSASPGFYSRKAQQEEGGVLKTSFKQNQTRETVKICGLKR